MSDGKGGVVGLSIDVIILATLGVTAVGLLISGAANVTGTTNILIFGTVLPIIVGVGFLLLILKRAGYEVRI
jgi:hypothetical protein